MILRAATLDNAIALGLSHELGSIEVGKRADLLLLKENPLTNVSAYDSIETIFLKASQSPEKNCARATSEQQATTWSHSEPAIRTQVTCAFGMQIQCFGASSFGFSK